MFMSKIQVKNLLIKELGKHALSKSMRGRITNYSSSGLMLEEKENGFIGIRYFSSGYSFEEEKRQGAPKLERVKNYLLSAGFEFDGINGYRKERKAK
jgi:hypothetical protein